MSHFSVGVICEGPSSVIDCLMPYCESAEEYYEKVPIVHIKEYIEKYRKNNPECTMTDDEIIEKDFKGEERDEDAVYYWSNPNTKWDWYRIGGRWRKSLKVSKKAEAYLEEELETEEDKNLLPERGKYRWVDAAPIKEILWKQMNTLPRDKRKVYNHFWDVYVSKTVEDDSAKDEYKTIYKPEYFLAKYKTKEEFIRRASLFLTHDLYIEPTGEWLTQGEMGWFGLDDSTPESTEKYEKRFYEAIQNPEYQDLWLVIVDCHI